MFSFLLPVSERPFRSFSNNDCWRQTKMPRPFLPSAKNAIMRSLTEIGGKSFPVCWNSFLFIPQQRWALMLNWWPWPLRRRAARARGHTNTQQQKDGQISVKRKSGLSLSSLTYLEFYDERQADGAINTRARPANASSEVFNKEVCSS